LPIDKSKIIEAANKYLQKGQIDKAIKEFSRITEVDPRDVRVRLKLGELYARKGMRGEAVNEYRLVAEEYTRAGFYSKAVAVYKQALKVDIRQVDIYSKLGDLYQKLGLTNEAMTQYKIVANYYDKEKMARECLEVLKKIVELDPKNLSNRVKLAESYSQGNLRKEADEEFGKVINTLKEQGRTNDLITLYERMLAANPKYYSLIKELSKIYLERGEPQRALIKLQMPLKEGVKDKGVLSLLAEVYKKLDRVEKAKTALKELARLCEEKGEIEGKEEAYRRVLQCDSQDPDALRVLGLTASAPAPKERVLKEEPQELRVEAQPEQELRVEAKPEPAPARARGEDSISRHFTEAEIYLKYGLKGKALEQYGLILKLQPDNDQALSKLRDLAASAEERDKVVSQFIVLAEECLKREEKQNSDRFLKEILKIDPENSQANKLLGISVAPAEAPAEEELREKEAPGIELEVEEHLVEGAAEEEAPAISLEAGREEDVALEEPIIQVEPEPVQTPLDEPIVQEIELEVKEEDSVVTEELDEAEFYIQQGLYDEAKRIYQKILRFHPQESRVELKLKELSELEGREQEVPSVSEPEVEEVEEKAPKVEAAPGTEELFDLAKELEEELAAEEPGKPSVSIEGPEGKEIFEDTFQEFKKGVEKTLNKQDADTHYDLGIAYKEMGLLDDAIEQFEVALESPKKEVNCCAMIGLCYMEKGEPKRAMDYYFRALANSEISGKEKVGLNYELAVVLEANGNLDKALERFEKVEEMEKDFRDVEDRLAGLRKKAAVPPSAEEKVVTAAEVEVPPAPEKEVTPAPEEEAKKVISISGRKRSGKKISYV
jgi:tetratricopeptide (TPR) repeat protein